MAASLCALAFAVFLLTRTPGEIADATISTAGHPSADPTDAFNGGHEPLPLRTENRVSGQPKPGADASEAAGSQHHASPAAGIGPNAEAVQPATLQAALPGPMADGADSRTDATGSQVPKHYAATPSINDLAAHADFVPSPFAAPQAEALSLPASSASKTATETPLPEPSAQVAASSSGTSISTATGTATSSTSGTASATATATCSSTVSRPQSATRAVDVAAAGHTTGSRVDLAGSSGSENRDGSVEPDDDSGSDDGEELPVPAIIHTAWHSKTLPRGMRASVKALMEANPEFELRVG